MKLRLKKIDKKGTKREKKTILMNIVCEKRVQ
jgi:hypothetical protein